ncbi:CLIP-associating protein 1 [Chelonia mydas]|uniref:CLIP-associating protein 1 n=1 Tax=Chelonia mydas TaxID=8469 RepID=M7BJU2_CHEMY|nr:CLIP-associating protein 1 [Chelonia mydas]
MESGNMDYFCDQVALVGLDVLGAFVDRLSGHFKSYVPTVLLALIDRMGDAKDQVREQAQTLILKLMDQAAPPMVRDAALLAIVEIYRHVGEKVRADLNKRGIPSARLQAIFAKFDEVRDSGNMILSNISARPGYYCTGTDAVGNAYTDTSVHINRTGTDIVAINCASSGRRCRTGTLSAPRSPRCQGQGTGPACSQGLVLA